MRISDWSSDVCSSDLPVLVQATGPGDLVDKREAADELAVGAIEHIEEAVAVGGGRGLDILAPFLVVEGDHLVDAVIRSEDRSVGKESVSTYRSRWSTYNS